MIETLAQAVAYLDDHIGEGIRPGLTRTSELLELMGNPQESYRIVMITGTNGKTSTNRILSSILAAHGLRVGSFTSPHLERIEERFALDNDPATEEDFVQAVADVAVFCDLYEQRAGERLTYFELTTVIAYAFFAAQAVDVAVVEVGMGGRLDATNAADAEVAVITGVSLDHTEVLGETIAEIAREKVGITRPNGFLIEGPLPDEARDVTVAYCEAHDIDRMAFDVELFVGDHAPAVGGWLATIQGRYATYEDVFLPLFGRHQLTNLATAIGAAEALFERALATDALEEGAGQATVPGRLETVRSEPLIVIDGAHNPAGMEAAAAALDDAFGDRDWTVVFAAMSDKSLEPMMQTIGSFADRVVTTAVDHPRAADPDQLASLVGQLVDVPVESAPTVGAALAVAQRDLDELGAVLIVGSLYLAGEARTLLA